MPVRGRPRSFDRQEALLRAMEVFWLKGYENASLADLTQAMGLNPPSLYAAFGSKEGLFREAVELYSGREGGGIWEHLETAPTAREAITRLLRASAEAFTRGPSRGCMIVLAALEQQGSNPGVCDDLMNRRRANRLALENRLKRGVEAGELPEDLDCNAVAAYYATVQHGLSIQARDGADRATLLAVTDSATAAWDAVIAANRRPVRAP